MRENASQDATAGTFLALEIRSLPVECRSCVGPELNGSVNSFRGGAKVDRSGSLPPLWWNYLKCKWSVVVYRIKHENDVTRFTTCHLAALPGTKSSSPPKGNKETTAIPAIIFRFVSLVEKEKETAHQPVLAGATCFGRLINSKGKRMTPYPSG